MPDIKPKAVVAIIRVADRFLMVKRSEYVEQAKGYWCPISGRLEDNESQEQAIKREVMEEVGLNVRALRPVCDIPAHNNDFQLYFWTTEIISGEARITSNEASELKWVTIKEMRALKPVFAEDLRIFESLD